MAELTQPSVIAAMPAYNEESYIGTMVLKTKQYVDEVIVVDSLNLSLAPWRGQGFIDTILSVILIVTIAGSMGTLGYVIVKPKVGEKFTEFYILGLEGKAIDYPRELKVGEPGKVMVGIINREHETVSYWVKVRIDGVRNNEVGPLVLEHDETWEEVVSFTPHRAGDSHEVEFLLYKDKESESYLKPLRLWIDVKE